MFPKWIWLLLTLLIEAVSSFKCYHCDGPADCSSTLTRYDIQECKTNRFDRSDLMCFVLAHQGDVIYKGCGRRYFIGLMRGGEACRQADGEHVKAAVQWLTEKYTNSRSISLSGDDGDEEEEARKSMIEWTDGCKLLDIAKGQGQLPGQGRYVYSESSIYRLCACSKDDLCNKELGVIGENYPNDGDEPVGGGGGNANGNSEGNDKSGGGGGGTTEASNTGGGNTGGLNLGGLDFGGGKCGGGYTGGGNKNEGIRNQGKSHNLPDSKSMLGAAVTVAAVVVANLI